MKLDGKIDRTPCILIRSKSRVTVVSRASTLISGTRSNSWKHSKSFCRRSRIPIQVEGRQADIVRWGTGSFLRGRSGSGLWGELDGSSRRDHLLVRNFAYGNAGISSARRAGRNV